MPDKLFPHNIDVEQAVLASMIINPKSLTQAPEILKPSSFYRTAHRLIFEACLSLFQKNLKVDLVTLTDHLRDNGLLEKVGGAGYLASLTDNTPLPPNVEQYCNIILSKALKREIIEAGNEIIKIGQESTNEAFVDLDKAQQLIHSIKQNQGMSFTDAPDLIQSNYKRYEKLYSSPGDMTGIPSGYPDLDKYTCGFQNSDLTIIAGRPSMGKTALMLNFVKNNSVCGICCGIFSLEMSKEQLSDRLMAMVSGVNTIKFRSGQFSNENWAEITTAAGKIYNWEFRIDDTPNLSHLELRRRARRMVKKEGVEILFIDYLGLMSGNERKNRVEEISSISRSLKACAKELSVPVVALSQLNRSVESRENKRPRLSDLRDSGAIEQDADVVMFIYRDEVYNENSTQEGIAEVSIAKQRTGPTGTIRLRWNKYITRFDSIYDTQ